MTWTKPQRNVVIAAYLGWTLDAFDFFLMVFMFKDISVELHSSRQVVVTAVLLTLAMRPVGAFLFGRLGDRYGRKPALMWNILAYSLLEVASGFAPSMTTLLIVRALFGIAMGGEWGLGSALAMESIPASARGDLPSDPLSRSGDLISSRFIPRRKNPTGPRTVPPGGPPWATRSASFHRPARRSGEAGGRSDSRAWGAPAGARRSPP